MPAESQAQRGYLANKFGIDWMRLHHFDNPGKLPGHVGKKMWSGGIANLGNTNPLPKSLYGSDIIPAALTPKEMVLTTNQQKAIMPIPGKEHMLKPSQLAAMRPRSKTLPVGTFPKLSLPRLKLEDGAGPNDLMPWENWSDVPTQNGQSPFMSVWSDMPHEPGQQGWAMHGGGGGSPGGVNPYGMGFWKDFQQFAKSSPNTYFDDLKSFLNKYQGGDDQGGGEGRKGGRRMAGGGNSPVNFGNLPSGKLSDRPNKFGFWGSNPGDNPTFVNENRPDFGSQGPLTAGPNEPGWIGGTPFGDSPSNMGNPSAGAFWSPPGGSIGGPLGTGSAGSIGWDYFGNESMKRLLQGGDATLGFGMTGNKTFLPPSQWGGVGAGGNTQGGSKIGTGSGTQRTMSQV